MTDVLESEGGIKMYIACDISIAELASWSPEQIEMLFAGIAQVVRARTFDQRLAKIEATSEKLREESDVLDILLRKAEVLESSR